MATKRLYGRQYELAHIYAPKKEGEYVLSKRRELRDGKGHDVYESLRDDERMARNYDEQQRYQYLRGLFFCLSTQTPVSVVRTAGTVMHVPTNELEREEFPHKETECIELSLRVHLQEHQVPMVQDMMAVVEKKMKNFATDFYLHDMKPLARNLGVKPFLWVCGESHTFIEFLDAAGEASYWAEHIDRCKEMVYGGIDDTWMGAALRVAIGQDDLLYYHDGSMLHKVGRDRFVAIHDRHVSLAKCLAKEKLEEIKMAA